MDFGRAEETLSDLRYGIARIRDGEDLDGLHLASEVNRILAPEFVPFLRRIDTMDPVELARDLPPQTAALVLRGTEDSQITAAAVDRLMTGLPGARRVDLDGADHVFRMYSDAPGAAVLDADRRFSPDVQPALDRFLESQADL